MNPEILALWLSANRTRCGIVLDPSLVDVIHVEKWICHRKEILIFFLTNIAASFNPARTHLVRACAQSDAFLTGKLVDENDLSPLTACYTVVTEGTLHGRSGFVNIHGDHQLNKDGTFSSPPLPPGKYFLRFFGMLNPPSSAPTDESSSAKQSRVFDFFYPNTVSVSSASPFELRAGESVNLVVRLPKPSWFNISGASLGICQPSVTSWSSCFRGTWAFSME